MSPVHQHQHHGDDSDGRRHAHAEKTRLQGCGRHQCGRETHRIGEVARRDQMWRLKHLPKPPRQNPDQDSHWESPDEIKEHAMPLYSEPDPCPKLSVPSVIIPLPPT